MLAHGPSGSAKGKVAKGCHSRSGDEEIARQENLWMAFGKERRNACVDSGRAVKVQRRSRSHGYTRSTVMRIRFQNDGFLTNSSPNDVDANDPCHETSTTSPQNPPTQHHPKNRCVTSNPSCDLLLTPGTANTKITPNSTSITHASTNTVYPYSPLLITLTLKQAVKRTHHIVPATPAPLCIPP
ncbi:integral membrane protein [Pyrenophora tritici-repentis]|uniref:Integral membrane protein n=1 Tax=Pyrenophora tritici-repentis TaxID=45151 RepID=A0A922NMA4_9PLEO|nr:integral membrane protein [Pyrenophora tritici-repentis]